MRVYTCNEPGLCFDPWWRTHCRPSPSASKDTWEGLNSWRRAGGQHAPILRHDNTQYFTCSIFFALYQFCLMVSLLRRNGNDGYYCVSSIFLNKQQNHATVRDLLRNTLLNVNVKLFTKENIHCDNHFYSPVLHFTAVHSENKPPSDIKIIVSLLNLRGNKRSLCCYLKLNQLCKRFLLIKISGKLIIQITHYSTKTRLLDCIS